jgi:hypothetical protein
MFKELPAMVKKINDTYLNIAPVSLAGALLVNSFPAINHLPRIVVGALTHFE